jgi:hypothetical protein
MSFGCGVEATRLGTAHCRREQGVSSATDHRIIYRWFLACCRIGGMERSPAFICQLVGKSSGVACMMSWRMSIVNVKYRHETDDFSGDGYMAGGGVDGCLGRRRTCDCARVTLSAASTTAGEMAALTYDQPCVLNAYGRNSRCCTGGCHFFQGMRRKSCPGGSAWLRRRGMRSQGSLESITQNHGCETSCLELNCLN